MSVNPYRPPTFDRGQSLVLVQILTATILMLAIGSLASSRSDLRASRNYRNGIQALLAAEAGTLHARTSLEQVGVTRFDEQIVDHWDDIFGTDWFDITGFADVRYSVSGTGHTLDPTNKMWLDSVGTGPEGARREVQALLELGGVLAPGAIYLASPGVQTTFNGNKFLIDGTDYNLDGSTTGDQVAGIATIDEADAEAVSDTLPNGREDNVVGLGGDESIYPSDGWLTADMLANDIVPGILAQPGVVSNPVISGSDIFGVPLLPQITHFSGDVTLNGNVAGAGILVVEGSLTISGGMDFIGLAIVLGSTNLTSLSGNSSFLGALWTTSLNVNVSGSMSLSYSSEALEVADMTGIGGVLPRMVNVVSWRQK